MQNNKNLDTNTSTFPEIWAKMTSMERDDLALALYNAKCCRSRQAIWNWANGKRQPNSLLVKEAVAKIVGKAIGSRVFAHTLFPIA